MGQGQSEELQLQPLTEKYSLGKTKFGEGAYGTVWKGTDRQTGNVVAIKQMSKAKLKRGGVKLRDNMGREVVMMRACQHENIAQLFGVFQEEKHVYLVMECCEGGDIGERVIGQKASVSEEQSAEWSRQMCAAVASLHGMRICHRDLKPQNYMLARGSTLKLSDFGLAVFVPKGQNLSDRCGTPGYMSPEVHLLPSKSRGYSFPADSWALGLSIYMLVFRDNPFLDTRGFVDETSLLNGRLTFGEDNSSLGLLLQTFNISSGKEQTSMSRRPEVRELLKQLICVDESQRLSPAQALQNPWLQHFGARLRERKASKDPQNAKTCGNLVETMPQRLAPTPVAEKVPPTPVPDLSSASWPLSHGTPFVRNSLPMPLHRSQSLQGAMIPELATVPFAAQSLPQKDKDLPNLLKHQQAEKNEAMIVPPGASQVPGPHSAPSASSSSSQYSHL